MDQTEKARRLRKYEASDDVLFSLSRSPRIDFLSPFGPLIAKTTVAPDLIEYLNQRADETLTTGTGAEFQLSGEECLYGGDDSLKCTVADAIRCYVEAVENETPKSVDFDVFWVVSQYAGTPSPVHFHSGDISGVLYLKVPDVDPEEEFRNYISGRQAGFINFLIGGKQRFSRSLISFRPVIGELYIVPGWVLH